MNDDLNTWLDQQLENQRFRAGGLKAMAFALPSEARAVLTETAEMLLADVDAKRRILDRHIMKTGEHVTHGICAECGGSDWKPGIGHNGLDPYPWVMPWPCPTLKLLALPYADREGYREEWRP